MFRLNEPMPYVMTAIAAVLTTTGFIISPEVHDAWMWRIAAFSILSGLAFVIYATTDWTWIKIAIVPPLCAGVWYAAAPPGTSVLETVLPAMLCCMGGNTIGSTIAFVLTYLGIDRKEIGA